MNTSIIVFAPQGAGLGEAMAEKLRKHFDLRKVYDQDCPTLYSARDLPANDHLILAHSDTPPASKLRTLALAQALKLMGGVA